jgi:hypothetical protein
MRAFKLNSDCHKSSGWKIETCREFIIFLNEYADIHLTETEPTLICSNNAMEFVEKLPVFQWSPVKCSGISIPDYIGHIQFKNKKIKFIKDKELENVVIKTQSGNVIASN